MGRREPSRTIARRLSIRSKVMIFFDESVAPGLFVSLSDRVPGEGDLKLNALPGDMHREDAVGEREPGRGVEEDPVLPAELVDIHPEHTPVELDTDRGDCLRGLEQRKDHV